MFVLVFYFCFVLFLFFILFLDFLLSFNCKSHHRIGICCRVCQKLILFCCLFVFLTCEFFFCDFVISVLRILPHQRIILVCLDNSSFLNNRQISIFCAFFVWFRYDPLSYMDNTGVCQVLVCIYKLHLYFNQEYQCIYTKHNYKLKGKFGFTPKTGITTQKNRFWDWIEGFNNTWGKQLNKYFISVECGSTIFEQNQNYSTRITCESSLCSNAQFVDL